MGHSHRAWNFSRKRSTHSRLCNYQLQTSSVCCCAEGCSHFIRKVTEMHHRHLFAAAAVLTSICLALCTVRSRAEERATPNPEAATFEGLAAGFQKLFNEGKAADLAASFAPDGELIDDEG